MQPQSGGSHRNVSHHSVSARQVDVDAAVAVQPPRDNAVVEQSHLQSDRFTQAGNHGLHQIQHTLELLLRTIGFGSSSTRIRRVGRQREKVVLCGATTPTGQEVAYVTVLAIRVALGVTS